MPDMLHELDKLTTTVKPSFSVDIHHFELELPLCLIHVMDILCDEWLVVGKYVNQQPHSVRRGLNLVEVLLKESVLLWQTRELVNWLEEEVVKSDYHKCPYKRNYYSSVDGVGLHYTLDIGVIFQIAIVLPIRTSLFRIDIHCDLLLTRDPLCWLGV